MGETQIRWWENERFQRAAIFIILLVSPVGAPAIALFLDATDTCRGGFDTDWRCSSWVPLQGYLEGVYNLCVMFIFLGGIGLIWVIAALYLPFGILWNLFHGIRDQMGIDDSNS